VLDELARGVQDVKQALRVMCVQLCKAVTVRVCVRVCVCVHMRALPHKNMRVQIFAGATRAGVCLREFTFLIKLTIPRC